MPADRPFEPISEETFRIDYWKVAAALCRAFEHDRDSELFWRTVVELDAAYPQFDWRNVMTDSWPLTKPTINPTHVWRHNANRSPRSNEHSDGQHEL